MKICPYCNAEIGDDSIFCCVCGSNLETGIKAETEYPTNEDVVVVEENYFSDINEENFVNENLVNESFVNENFVNESFLPDNENSNFEYENHNFDYDEVISESENSVLQENSASQNENFQYPYITQNNYPIQNINYLPENDNIYYNKKLNWHKIALIGTTVCCTVLICCYLFFGIWHLKDIKRMEEAAQATEIGDYKKAVDLYSEIMPFGELKKEANNLSAVVSEAGVSFEAAETALKNYEYVSAMENANKTIEVCPSFKKANEIFDTAKNDLGRYFQKKFDAGEYSSILSANTLKEEWRSDQVNELLQKVNNMITQDISNGHSYLNSDNPSDALQCAKDALAIDSSNQEAISLCNDVANHYINKGNNCLQSGNTTSATEFANLAEKANPNNSGIETLRNNISQYNADYAKYTGWVSEAREAYNNSDIKGAYNLIKDIPGSGAGNAVINNNYSIIDTIKSDYSHLDKLVSNNGYRWTTISAGNSGAAIVNVDLTNNISLSVGVQVQFYFNGREHYATFTLPGNSSKTFTCNFNNVRIYGNNENCTVKVTSSWII